MSSVFYLLTFASSSISETRVIFSVVLIEGRGGGRAELFLLQSFNIFCYSRWSAGVFLLLGELVKMKIPNIPFCDAWATTKVSTRKGLQQILLTKPDCLPEARVHAAKCDLRDLARKLSHDNPRIFSLFSCKGIIEQVNTTIPGMPA